METINTADILAQSLAQTNLSALVSTGEQQKLFSHYSSLPLPTKKEEPYRYSQLAKQFGQERKLAKKRTLAYADIAEYILTGITQFAVFVNGIFDPKLSVLRDGSISVHPLSELSGDKAVSDLLQKQQNDKFSALNATFATDGICLKIAKNCNLAEPIQLLFIGKDTSPSIANIKNIIVAERSSSARFLASYVSEDSQLLTNIHTDIIVGENAQVEYNVLANESDSAILVNAIAVDQKKHSTFSGNILSLNAGSIRTNIFVDQNDEFCQTNLNGLYLSSKTQHFDNYALVNHNKPNGTTNEVFKGIAKDKSTGAFAGTIYVAPDAQKTLANQSNKNILLSDDATVHSKPQLLIYADDVSCSHGSTTGQLDKEQLFYMRSRGINYDKAVNLLLSAFFGDVTDNLSIDALREMVVRLIETKI